jgi:hypothetical protein
MLRIVEARQQFLPWSHMGVSRAVARERASGDVKTLHNESAPLCVRFRGETGIRMVGRAAQIDAFSANKSAREVSAYGSGKSMGRLGDEFPPEGIAANSC